MSAGSAMKSSVHLDPVSTSTAAQNALASAANLAAFVSRNIVAIAPMRTGGSSPAQLESMSSPKPRISADTLVQTLGRNMAQFLRGRHLTGAGFDGSARGMDRRHVRRSLALPKG